MAVAATSSLVTVAVIAAFRMDFSRLSLLVGGGEVSQSSLMARMYSRTWSMNQKTFIALNSGCIDIASLKGAQVEPLIAAVTNAHSSLGSTLVALAASTAWIKMWNSVI